LLKQRQIQTKVLHNSVLFIENKMCKTLATIYKREVPFFCAEGDKFHYGIEQCSKGQNTRLLILTWVTAKQQNKRIFVSIGSAAHVTDVTSEIDLH